MGSSGPFNKPKDFWIRKFIKYLRYLAKRSFFGLVISLIILFRAHLHQLNFDGLVKRLFLAFYEAINFTFTFFSSSFNY